MPDAPYRFNKVILTDESMEKARQFYINNCEMAIKQAESGEVYVNDLPSYVAWQNERITRLKDGTEPMSLTFLQRAYYEQTGESVALLP